MIIGKMASSVDPDEMDHYEPSHLDLHRLHRSVPVYRAERINHTSHIVHFQYLLKLLKNCKTVKTLIRRAFCGV